MKGKLLSVLVIVLVLSGCTGTAQKEVSMQLQSFQGDVKINGAAASPESILTNGDTVSTGAQSVCDIIFDDKNILRLSENTQIVFKTNASGRTVVMDSGAAMNVMRKLPKAQDDLNPPYHIETKTAVCAVRGTVFYVKVEDEANTYICICNGALFVGDQGGNTLTNTIAAIHHKAIRYSNISNAIVTNDAAMLYHTDADMEAVAAKINEKIDWTKQEN